MSDALGPYPVAGYISSPYSGSASPVSARPTPPPGSKPGSSRNTPKPVNVFTNDGSFLERIQRSKRRNRGKRRHPEPAMGNEDVSKPDLEGHPAKKAKSEDDITEADYGKQLRTFGNREGMKDTGTGVRPLVR
ncbi:hypothetical protein C0992_004111 [Termitomyces sp. T32_za158]|nr:hypothetical protein C0992_004111 [Termitomyces sp. T32_za158]